MNLTPLSYPPVNETVAINIYVDIIVLDDVMYLNMAESKRTLRCIHSEAQTEIMSLHTSTVSCYVVLNK